MAVPPEPPQACPPAPGRPAGPTAPARPSAAPVRPSAGPGAAPGPAPAWPLRLLRVPLFHLVVLSFCAVSLGWSLLAPLLGRVLPRARARAVGRGAISRGFRFGLGLMRATGLARFDLSALDALADAGPMVIACNHRSLLDAVLVVSRLPRAVCIARAGLLEDPFLGGGARLAGYIRNDAPLSLVRAAVAALREGCQLVVFPEGTRGRGPGPLPFRPGFASMARRAAVPVQLVLLDSDTPYLGPGWPLYRRPRLPLRYRARLGPRLCVTGRAAAAAAMMERLCHEELLRP